AKHWLNSIDPSIGQWGFMAAWEFLYYDEDGADIDYTKTLPVWYFAAGPGLLLRRSDWTRSGVYFGIWAGPLVESHQDFDVNGFQIFQGDWLAGNAIIWSTDGVSEQSTEYHNNLTFGGAGQTWQNPDLGAAQDAGKTLLEENTSEYSYFAG